MDNLQLVVQWLLGRLAEQQPLLMPEQEAASLVQQVRQQLLLRRRLAQRMGGARVESIEFEFRGCTVELRYEYEE